eukprot:5209171-Amphidinium_carterae.2
MYYIVARDGQLLKHWPEGVVILAIAVHGKKCQTNDCLNKDRHMIFCLSFPALLNAWSTLRCKLRRLGWTTGSGDQKLVPMLFGHDRF